MERLRTWREPWARGVWLGLGLFFQKPCAACGARVADPREAGLCPACWGDLERWPLPAVKVHLGEEPDFEPLAAFAYEGWLRELVHAWKFEGRSALTRPLARCMARRLEALGAGGYDLAVVLPPNPDSLRERGFDAAGELARSTAASLGLPVAAPLRQVRQRQRQSGLKHPERLMNAMGLYALKDKTTVKGLSVLILDDLLTTGATAQAAAAALLDGGAERVGVGVLAHAVGA